MLYSEIRPSEMPAFFGGVEGGGTNTIAIIVDDAGNIVARQAGPGSNGWLLGAEKVADILVGMFAAAKAEASIASDAPLHSIGMCMSGFLQLSQQDALKAALRARDPHLAHHLYVDNDSPGSIYTAAGPAGGMVIISGTGSMAQVIDGAGVAHNCGGWGHMFGDEGGAYWIASQAVRRVVRATDGFASVAVSGGAGAGHPLHAEVKPLPDVARAHALMCEHFGIAGRDGLLDHFYKAFEKAKVAGLTRHLAAAAAEGDAFCAGLFTKAGLQLGSAARTLARHLLAPAPASASSDASAAASSSPSAAAPTVTVVRIVCVGSVWKSWPLLKDGFIAAATAAPLPGPDGVAPPQLRSFELVRLTETSAVGAAWKGAVEAGKVAGAASAVVPALRFDSFVETLYKHAA